MVSQKVYDLFQGSVTVSSELAQDPTLSPGKVAKKLYGDDVGGHDEHQVYKPPMATKDDLDRAYRCGKWGSTRPSDLFLRVYHDVLCTLEGDPMVGVTSPPLMGSSGVMPLTIIAPLPDIIRHMSNCIARARKEVFLATNYWQASDASTIITNSLKELSRRAGERGEKAIVKVMYDRGSATQVLDNHQPVSPAEYTGKNIRLPASHEIPHVDLQVINYHRPIFGTFHSKYMVVDRRIAIISSNNIQDNDNLEMMTHMEGPIVDSFYDMSLISWHNQLIPTLPSHNSPAATGGSPSFESRTHRQLFDRDGKLIDHTLLNGSTSAIYSHQAHSLLADGAQGGFEGPDSTSGGDARTVQEVTRDGNLQCLPEHTSTDPHYDPDIAAEVTRAQSVLSPRGSETRMNAVTRHLNTTIQPDTRGDAPECAPGEEMTTLIPDPTHVPFPMAMVCRKPWGAPNHSCVHVPQNEAFLSAIRNARRNVFIQTPNLNAQPLLPALLEAVRRGVDVYYYVCLGYNDSGELLPFQGGTNEMVANKLYRSLSENEKDRLHIFNYVAKDQTRPIHNRFKKRSCHIKLMIVDEHIGIQGNGNQDTQSWYHSQEANVMIDSHTICAAWIDGIRRNQNTHIYGAVSREDGCWHDENGKQADGAIGVDPGSFAWAKGIVGAVQRVAGQSLNLAPVPAGKSRSGFRTQLSRSLQYLFPHARQRARARLSAFRHDTLPYYRQRAQSRIYRFIADRYIRHKQKRAAEKGIVALLKRRRRLSRQQPASQNEERLLKMTQQGASSSQNSTGAGSIAESSQRGARRRKLAGYLKTANELRQSYQQSYGSRGRHDAEADEDDVGIPGAFPDVAIVRSGDEEMILFPSYARRHTKKEQPRPSKDQREAPGTTTELRDESSSSTGDEEFWRKQWDKHEDEHAVVDVDVRGWMYSPHRGLITRKNRLLIGLARHLSGIPAPGGGSRSGSRATSPHSTHPERLEARAARHEEALVEKQAANMTKKGEAEADVAGRGGYSEKIEEGWDKASIYSTPEHSRSPSPEKSREPKLGEFPHQLTDSSLQSQRDDAPGPGFLGKRASWNQPADMSHEELAVANAHLMARLKPFLTNPLVGTPLTIFFYNDQTSQSRTIVTNDAGHFSLRAALDFIPTHVRVLASENLSATEEVIVTEPTGISLISDIDDTIKHSAIGSGVKETFRNVFIRELSDLAIEGVKEWYTKLAELGVKLHYVSNSPWQLYPVLVSFFALAGLPPGSFHLKQYSGMLQGIFEPVAERKKVTLERILHDFPERRFLLVGDSGEADLELYTDIVVANPGRILGVFIRDVTTPPGHGFFDPSMGPLTGNRSSSSTSRGRAKNGQSSSPGLDELVPARKPILPARNGYGLDGSQDRPGGNVTGTLIDLSDDSEPARPVSSDMTGQKHSPVEKKSTAPMRPSKPMALRSASGGKDHSLPSVEASSSPTQKRGPVKPPKPRTLSVSHDSPQPKNHSPLSRTQNVSPPDTGSRATSSERRGYRSTVRNKVTSAYNSIPSPSTYWYGASSPTSPASSSGDKQHPGLGLKRTMSSSGVSKVAQQQHPPPPPPPRRHLTSYPAAAAQYASHRISGVRSSGGNNDGSSDDVHANNTTQPVNKKLELWKRRWARAKKILDAKGVMLRSWRVGTDVMDDAVRLVERAKKESE